MDTLQGLHPSVYKNILNIILSPNPRWNTSLLVSQFQTYILYYCASLTVIFLYMTDQIISVDVENCESTHDVICVSALIPS